MTDAGDASENSPQDDGGVSENESLIQTIHSLAGELQQLESDAARFIAERLVSLAQQAAADALQEEIARGLLTCLILADEAASRNAPDLGPARNRLRELIFGRRAEWGYILVEEQLVGQPLDSCAHLVEVLGLVPSRQVRSNCVAQVVQPGYLFVQNGRETVVQRAKVRVAE